MVLVEASHQSLELAVGRLECARALLGTPLFPDDQKVLQHAPDTLTGRGVDTRDLGRLRGVQRRAAYAGLRYAKSGL